MGFSRQENWKGCHTLLLGFFLTQGLNTSLLRLLHWQGGFFTTSATWEAPYHIISSVQSLSPIPTLYNPMDCSTPGFPVHHQLLELALECLLDCKEIQPVHSEGDQSWVFIGRTDAEAKTPVL